MECLISLEDLPSLYRQDGLNEAGLGVVLMCSVLVQVRSQDWKIIEFLKVKLLESRLLDYPYPSMNNERCSV